MSSITERLEAAGVATLLWGLGRLPLDVASASSGALARWIGPHTGRHQVAEKNLRLALPSLAPEERNHILLGMWDNLGRTLGELAHLAEFDCYGADGRVQVVGVEHLDRFRDDGVGGIAFSAHLGWWDLTALALNQRGMDAQMIYRAENNPLVGARLLKARSPAGTYLPKGAGTARDMVAGLKAGRHYGLLLDQKMNDGIPLPFFGRKAMTAPAAALFAVRDKTPLLPVRCERLGGAHFRVTFYPLIDAVVTGNRTNDVAATACKLNDILEDWVRERPEQWLWIHHRWPDD